MRTLIGFITSSDLMPVKEAYQTIKNRLFKIGDFIEATNAEGKITLSKQVIGVVSPMAKEIKKETKGKTQKKG